MQLRQSELLGIFYHHHRRVWDIYSDFDYGRGEQYLDSVLSERRHRCLLVTRAKTSMREGDTVWRKFLLQTRELFRGGFDSGIGVCYFRTSINNVSLPVLLELLAHEF